jgi:hypothetical protein
MQKQIIKCQCVIEGNIYFIDGVTITVVALTTEAHKTN